MTTRPSRRRPTAALAAPALLWTCLLAACSADFKSGMTKCAANKACPDGFTCNSLGYCATPGGAQSPPGTDGGVSGMGGTSGLDGGPKPGGTGGTTTFPSGTGGSGGGTDAGPPPSGSGSVKFCNSIVRTNPNDMTMDVETTLTAVIDGQTRLTAKSGTCSTALNAACTSVSAGQHSVALMEGTTMLDMATFSGVGGGEYIMYTDVENNAVVLKGGELQSPNKCSTFNPFTGGMMGMMPMPPTGMTAPIKFCHDLTLNGQNITLDLVVGNVKMSATTGTCSTPVGQACVGIPLGNQTLTMFQGTTMLATTTLNVTAGNQYIAAGTLDMATPPKPIISAGALKTELMCASFDPFTMP